VPAADENVIHKSASDGALYKNPYLKVVGTTQLSFPRAHQSTKSMHRDSVSEGGNVEKSMED
jgi:hypothetical protein